MSAFQSFLKVPAVRSESYRRFVAAHPCFDCGVHGYSQCAHANEGKGLGLKVCDLRSFPLCGPRPGHMGCHTRFDSGLDYTREERRELGRRWVERMQQIAREAGRKELA